MEHLATVWGQTCCGSLQLEAAQTKAELENRNPKRTLWNNSDKPSASGHLKVAPIFRGLWWVHFDVAYANKSCHTRAIRTESVYEIKRITSEMQNVCIMTVNECDSKWWTDCCSRIKWIIEKIFIIYWKLIHLTNYIPSNWMFFFN